MDDVQIEQIQQCQLETLKYFIGFCETHHIKYYVAGGTLLGAARHQGFIPWDDDIDLAIPREDYNKLLSLRDELKYPYVLRNAQYDPEMKSLFSKIENVATTKIVDLGQGKEYIGGLSIDLFPQDGVSDNILAQIAQIRFIEIIMGKVVCPLMNSDDEGMQRKRTKWLRILERCCSFFSYYHSHTARSFYGVYGAKETYQRGLFGNGVSLPFAGIAVNAPEKWDAYLTQMYGNYMVPPPVEKRSTTHNYKKIDLNTSYLTIEL